MEGYYHDITGTTTITGLGTVRAGIVKVLQFDDVLTVTHNGTSLILKYAQNHLTTAGDIMAFMSLGSGNWKEIWRDVAGGDAPPGTVKFDAGTSAPAGWLHAYGQAVSRTTYSAIFARLSTTYGVGDGATTFNLPDLRGRVIAGQDDMGGSSANRLTDQSGGLDGDTLGDTGGTETHVLTTGELPAHDHGSGGAHTHAQRYESNADGAGASTAILATAITSESVLDNTSMTQTTASDGAHTHTSVGSGTAHNNIQPTIILNAIIKT